MTREEAINILKNMINNNVSFCRYTKLSDALIMAIKALEQEPCEDCISRKDVLAPYKELKDDDVISVWLIKKNIEQQLSVTPTRKKRMDEQTIKDINRAFKALEERDELLDKISAEIEQITDTMGVSYNQYVSKIDVLQIIDKYKAESEE